MDTQHACPVVEDSSLSDIRLRCPRCGTGIDRLECPACRFSIVIDHGIAHALPPESVAHHARFMARTAEPEGWTSQFREIMLDAVLVAHDLRHGGSAFDALLDPNDYVASQAFAATLKAAGSDGIVWPSLRQPGGECLGLFYPDCVRNAVQGRHLDYHWNGARVDFYRETASGAVFRIDDDPA